MAPEKAPEKSKGGALVALLASGPPAKEPMVDDHGFKAVARAFGIPPEREASAQAALKQYVRACVGSMDDSSEEAAEGEY